MVFYTEEPDICFLVISIKYYVKDIQLYEMKGMPTVALQWHLFEAFQQQVLPSCIECQICN